MNPSPPLSNPGRGWRARRDALAAAVLRLAVRVVPGERQREFGLTLVLGALCGLAAVAFHLALRGAEHGLIDRAVDAPGRSGSSGRSRPPSSAVLRRGCS